MKTIKTKFELLLETPITIPNMDMVKTHAKKEWSTEIENVTPSTEMVEGEQKILKVFRLNRYASSEECVDFIKAQGAALPNVFGLAVAELTVASQLPKDKWILGFDNRDNLSVYADPFRRVPYLCLSSDGTVYRDWYSWDGGWGAGHCLVLLCDNQSSDALVLKSNVDTLTLERAIGICVMNGYKVTKEF